MNDLLARGLNRGVRYDEDDRQNDLENDVKHFPPSVQLTNMKANTDGMGDFLRHIEVVQAEVNKMNQQLVSLQNVNEKSKGVYRADELKALRAQMDAEIASATKRARFIKVKLEELDRSNIEHRQVRGCEAGTASDRQRISLTENQRKKVKELMDAFQSLRSKMVDGYKETIERRYYTITGEQADEETIENLISTGESETLLQQAIREQGRGPVLEAVREIQERLDGVKEIEKHMLELHAIFMDISVLVGAQGDMINDIESNVQRSYSYIKKGGEHLEVAKRYQMSKRRTTIICVLLLIIIIAILVLVLVLKFK